MKTKIHLFAIFLLSSTFTFAQTASQVLENGKKVKTGEKVFLQYDNKIFKYALSKSLQDKANPISPFQLQDSTIFLIPKNGVNVYMRPLNPLNFSFGKEITQIIDPINLAAEKSLTAIIDVVKLAKQGDRAPANTNDEMNAANKDSNVFETCPNFTAIQDNLRTLQTMLKNSKKDKIADVFMELKALSFLEQEATLNDIKRIKQEQTAIKKHFDKVSVLIDTLTSQIGTYGCKTMSSFMIKSLFELLLKDFRIVASEQQKRFDHLVTAFKMVDDMASSAKFGGGVDGLRWCIRVADVTATDDKISILNLNIKENGLALSDKKEIENMETKEIIKTTIRMRKFQLFVPEISMGTALTFFKYKTYGTTTDANGQQYIAEGKENTVRNINITTMVNWNLYAQNSQVYPLIQVGAGLKEGMPTLFLGGGLRFGTNASNRIRITGGIAMTWVKELNKLKVGDKITGTTDIENDLVPQFSWPPKPYIGIQYNF